MPYCEVCGKEARKRCGRCKEAWYCSAQHQTEHWSREHKLDCKIEQVLQRMLRTPPAEWLHRRYQFAPRDAHCFICLEGGTDDEYLHAGCGCRGSAGWAHVSCVFEMCKDSTYESKLPLLHCPTCREMISEEMRVRVLAKYWRCHRVQANSWMKRHAESSLGNILTTFCPDKSIVINLQRRSIEKLKHFCSPDDQYLLNEITVLANAYIESGNPQEAVSLLQPHGAPLLTKPPQLFTNIDSSLGHTYAKALSKLNRCLEAETLVRRIISAPVVTKYPMSLASHLCFLGTVLSKQFKWNEAYSLFKEGHASIRKALGPDNPLTIEMAHKVAAAEKLCSGGGGGGHHSSPYTAPYHYDHQS